MKPKARLLVAEQRSEEWLKARLGIPTASRFNDIVALTRNGYSTQRKNYCAELVIQRLTQQIPEHYENAAMAWGTETEPVARLQYELLTGKEVEETGLWLLNDLDAGASPDGFVGKDGLLEIKCPNTATHLETLRTGNLPNWYKAQVQGQMWVTDRKWCDFVSFDPRLPENAQIIIIRVDRDDLYIKNLEEEVTSFLQEVEDQVEFVQNFGKESDA